MTLKELFDQLKEYIDESYGDLPVYINGQNEIDNISFVCDGHTDFITIETEE